MNILGIASYYHNSSAALIVDGKIMAAAEEERFTRIKNDHSFPHHSIRFCLQFSGLTLDDLDAVVFYDKPLLKFERLLETYLFTAPYGFLSFVKSMPVWLKQKLFLKRELIKELSKISEFDKKKIKLLYTEHHLSHAASSYYCSHFDEAVILTIDGVGEWATTSIYTARNNRISIEKEIKFPHSIGLLYSAVTYYCGFKVNSGEYKLMGLAPYGDRNSEQVIELVEKLKTHVVTIFEDGSFFLHQEYFKYAYGLRMTNDNKWETLFNISRRREDAQITAGHCNLALAIQLVTEEIVVKLAKHAIHITGIKNLCLAGGVALNCVANGKLYNSGIADNIYIQPASGDSGGSVGAALAAYHMYYGMVKQKLQPEEANNFSYLGPSYSNDEIKIVLDLHKAAYEYIDELALTKVVAEELSKGKIIGWFKGRMEFGPRALGNRSILADARNIEMQRKLNLSIKYRESFRPFAPCVIEEDAEDYFDITGKSPYMLNVQQVKSTLLKPIPKSEALSFDQRINQVRSDLPAITHIDSSARIQTVSKNSNAKLYNLLREFKRLTGCPVLVNTSFNVRGEPIVCTPAEALQCFMNTEMDYLVLENFWLKKSAQATTVKLKPKIGKD